MSWYCNNCKKEVDIYKIARIKEIWRYRYNDQDFDDCTESEPLYVEEVFDELNCWNCDSTDIVWKNEVVDTPPIAYNE